MPLIEKIQTRLKGWEASLLSPAGRVVMINAVLSAIPIYYLSVFKLPSWVIKKIDQIRCSFLWHGTKIEERKIHLVKWETVCKPKELGGLGIIDLKVFNEAMLAKWLWKWITQESGLWVDLIKQTIRHRRPWELDTNIACWRSIAQFCKIFENRLICQVKSGETVSLWHHDWGYGVLKYRFHDLYTFMQKDDCTIREALQHNFQHQHLFRTMNLSENAMSQLSQLKALLENLGGLDAQQKDVIIWREEASGSFTVKSFYKFIKHTSQPSSTLPTIWSLRIPPRIKFFAWLMLQDKILTVSNLQKRGWSLTGYCFLCKQGDDSIMHLFGECSFFIDLASLIISKYKLSVISPMSLEFNCLSIIQTATISRKTREILVIMCFIIWRERCNRIFRDQNKTAAELIHEVQDEWQILQNRRGI